MEDINHLFGVPTVSISFKCNCTELDESASGLPRASESLPKQKGKSLHFRGLNQCQKYLCCLKVSDSQWSLAPWIPRQRQIWKLQKTRWVVTHKTAAPGDINGICSRHALTALKDQCRTLLYSTLKVFLIKH